MKILTGFLKKYNTVLNFVYLAIAILAIVTQTELYSVIAFVLIISVILVISPSLGDCFTPFLMICGISIRLYDSFNTFIKYVYIIPFVVAAVIFHFVFYKKKYTVGESLRGICAVAVAVTLGGIGSMTLDEYKAGSNIYHMLALGVGMILLYIILRADINTDYGYDKKERFAKAMAMLILLGFFAVAYAYTMKIDVVLRSKRMLELQWSNNLSTLLMLAMPFSVYLSKRRPYVIPLLPMCYIAMIFTGSRAALLVGTVEFIVVSVYSVCACKNTRIAVSLILTAVIAAIVVLMAKCGHLFRFDSEAGYISTTEARFKLIGRSIEDFLSRPIFGRGLGYSGNVDLYSPKKGAMYFYHMMIPQIIGSMGTVGILAYGYQFVQRVRLIFRKISHWAMCLGLSYLGILLMSQVNPGEFCPIPYGMITVILFIFLENGEDKPLFGRKRKKNTTKEDEAGLTEQ